MGTKRPSYTARSTVMTNEGIRITKSVQSYITNISTRISLLVKILIVISKIDGQSLIQLDNNDLDRVLG
jgi:hypothetical protein